MSGRVQYTIPGYTSPGLGRGIDPTTAPERVSEARPTTGARTQEINAAPAESWREVLGLNYPQPGDLLLDPPAAPASTSYVDADETRRQWSGLMRRHSTVAPANPSEARMWSVLVNLREQENDLQARVLAEPKD